MKQILLFVIVFFCLTFDANAATLSRIQKGQTTMPAGSASVTQSITVVNLSQSFLVFTIRGETNRPGRGQVGGRMSGTNQLTFSRFETAGAVDLIIEWQVFEFSSGVSVQRGEVNALAGGGANVALTAVNTASSFALVNMRKDGGQYGSDDFVTADITTSTNLFLDREGGGANPQNVYWQVIDWTGASVQKITTTLSAGNDSTSVTLTSAVNKNKAMVVGNHRCTGNVNADDFPVTELVDGSTVSFSRVGTAQNMAFVCYVVEFSDNTDVVHGAIRMTAAQNSISTTICSVSTADSGIIPPSNFFRQGANCEVSDDEIGIAYATINLTGPTTVTATRAITGFAALFPFQVLEFTAATPAGCTPPEPGASTPRTSLLCGAELPVELLYFQAYPNGSEVDLTWATASEINSAYFILQRSQDGTNFENIDTITGAGNSSVEITYDRIDKRPYSGVSYYRLKQVDFDGAFTYSDRRTVVFEQTGPITIFPNPTNGSISIFLGDDYNTSGGEEWELFNAIGQRVMFRQAVSNVLEIDLSLYDSGVYYFTYKGSSHKILRTN